MRARAAGIATVCAFAAIAVAYAQPVVAANRAHRGEDDAVSVNESAGRSAAALHLDN